MRSKRCLHLLVLPRIPPTAAPFPCLSRRIQPAVRVVFLAVARQKVCRPLPKVARPLRPFCACFSPFFVQKETSDGGEPRPTSWTRHFLPRRVCRLRPRTGERAGEKRTLLPVTSPVCAAFRVDLPRIGERGLLGSAVGDGSHLTRRCPRRRPREHGDERHPCDCHHRNRRHHCRHKAHQAHKATFFPVQLFLHRTACSVP